MLHYVYGIGPSPPISSNPTDAPSGGVYSNVEETHDGNAGIDHQILAESGLAMSILPWQTSPSSLETGYICS